MQFYKFTNPNNEIVHVNLDNITKAKPGSDGFIHLYLANNDLPVTVSEKEFEAAAYGRRKDNVGELQSMTARLCDALNRLTIHIPTSIRLHI